MDDLEVSFKCENNLILTFSTKPPFSSLLIECQSLNENNTYKINLSLTDLHKKNNFFTKYKSLKEIASLFTQLYDDKKVKTEKTNKKIIISIDLDKNGIVKFQLNINNETDNDNVKIINNNISDILGKSQTIILDNLSLSNSAQEIANIVKNFEKNKSSNGLLRLYFLKKISNYLFNNNKIKNIFSEKILNLLDQINNNIHFIEEDSIKLESKKTYDILHFSNYLDKLISDLDINFNNFTCLLTSILKDEQKNEIDQYVKTLLSYDEYNTFFEPQIIKDLRNCFFDYSLVSCSNFEGVNLEEYKKRQMCCNNMKRQLLYYKDEDLKDIKNKYFSDSIDYVIFNSRKKNGNIIKKNEYSSFIAVEVFYDENKYKEKNDISDNELNIEKMIEPNGILSIKIKSDKKKEANNIYGNKYLISQEYQVLPLYKFSIKRNEYYVLHFDPEFKKKKEYLKRLQNVQKDQNLLNMNIYFESSIKAALKFILKRRYSKVILISSFGKDKIGIRFVETARKILNNFNVLVLFFSEDEKPIPEIGKINNCLYANKLDLYREYILNYNREGLNNLKKKVEDLYNIKFQFSSDLLEFTNAKDKGEFFSLGGFRSIYFREVYIKNEDNYIYIDDNGKTQITQKTDKKLLWIITLSEDNEITLFSNGFYLNISKDNCNTEGNYNTMIKWKFEKINDKFYRFICKRKENDNILSVEGKTIKVNKGDNSSNKFELIDGFEDDESSNSSFLSNKIVSNEPTKYLNMSNSNNFESNEI
jgi:hypothetical protein